MRKWIASLMVMVLFIAYTTNAFKLKDLFRKTAKTVVTAAVIKEIADELNNFINTITANRGLAAKEMTKVVPMITFDKRTYVGAAQVSGPEDKLKDVKAVMMIQTDFKTKGRWDVKIVVPVDSTNPLKANRVVGVGVTAIIQARI